MAPMSNMKRAQADDQGRRPKKKIKVKRRQTDYHSSEDEEPSENTLPVALATRELPKPFSTPRSILKQNSTAAQKEVHPTESDLEDADDIEEVHRNTALNAVQRNESEDEDQEYNDTADKGDQSNEISESEEEADSESDESMSVTSSNTPRTKKKRNDPTAFATSISKILSTKLSNNKRPDPVLSRSKSASETTKALADAKLEQKAQAQLRLEKKQALQKGRVTDVLGLETPDVDTGRLQEEERRFKKTAQRGVVKLFNAVRAAQVRAEEARKQNVVGMQKREDRVNEMSKEGFLELISRGGKNSATA